MITGHTYKLIKGKKEVGTVWSLSQYYGKSVVFPTLPSLKQSYFKKMETITVPMATRLILDDGVFYTFERYLDVSRKSQRQIDIIKKNYQR